MPDREGAKQVVESLVEEHGRAMLRAIPDLVFHLGRDGTYLDVFSAPDEDLFMPREALLGHTVLEILPPPVGADCMAAIGRLASEHEVATFDYSLPLANETRWFEGRVALAGPDSVICVVRDFTDQRRAEEALKEANVVLQARAAQLERLGRELTLVGQQERRRLAGVLHDQLQQLLVAAKFNVTIIEQRVHDEKVREVTARTKHVLDDAIAQSQSLTVALCPPVLREGNLRQALEWVVGRVGQDHGLQVSFVGGKDDCAQVPEDLRIMIFNAVRELLLNVIKHAGVRKAGLTLTCTEGREVVVAVSDQGCGFSPEQVALQMSDRGGFGLFAIRERIEPLGGSLTLESRAGEGTTVTIRAPLTGSVPAPEPVVRPFENAGANSGAGARPGPSSRAAQHVVRILLVDDHAVVRQGLAQLLGQDAHLQVVGEASDGREAIVKALDLRPDVVLMDVNMPGKNGVAATREIHAALPATVVIGLSMYEEPHRIDEMLAAGAAAYLSKTEAADRVVSTIEACCAARD